MAYYNENVLSSLIDAPKVENLEAIFYTKSQIFNCFLSNPQSINVDHSINLNTISLPGFKGDKHVYENKRSPKIELSGIIFDSYSLSKSLKPLLETIEKLMDPSDKNYEYVGFKFGTLDYYPCFITDFSYETELFLGGDPAKIKASIDLILSANLTEVEATKELENIEPKLAEYEKVEAIEQTEAEIEANPSLIGGSREYGRIITGDSELAIDDTGNISLIDRLLNEVRSIAVFDALNQSITWL